GMSEIIEADSGETAEAALARECDLAVIELDVGMDDAMNEDPGASNRGGMPDGLLCLRLAKGPPRPIPVIALAQNTERRALAGAVRRPAEHRLAPARQAVVDQIADSRAGGVKRQERRERQVRQGKAAESASFAMPSPSPRLPRRT